MNKMPIAACYCRLSNDDKEIGESASIENQRSLLNEYCISNGIPVADFYVDDGFTGTNFNRPDFIRMMNDINLGRANTIIVKDMSRFGREEARHFPRWGLILSQSPTSTTAVNPRTLMSAGGCSYISAHFLMSIIPPTHLIRFAKFKNPRQKTESV